LYRKTILGNGIRVVTEHIPYVRSVTIGFWFRTGSRDEGAENNGVSHLIEHMVFKGTTTRSAREIAETVDAAGGQLNAFTSKEHTCFYVRVLDGHLRLGVQVLSDMLLNSRFDACEMDKEKGVVIEEIRMYEDCPDELVHDMLAGAVLADHPLGKGILGTEAIISDLDRDTLVSHMSKHYTAGNLVVAAAGNVTHEQVVALVNEFLVDMEGDQTPVSTSNHPPAKAHSSVRTKDTEQVHLCLGGLGVGRHSEQRYALYVLDMALGGGMSSRLFQELREERGLVYATYSYHTLFQDTGLFSIYAGCGPANVPQVLELARAECDRLVTYGFDALELHRAKEQLKGSLVLSLESTANRMSRLAKGELFEEKVLTPDELIARIDAVTPSQVHSVAEKLLGNGSQVTVAIGPIEPSSVGIEDEVEG
jgi:predicted Zn-dependent peptidase